METPQSVREYWFGTRADDASVIEEQSPLWWGKDAAVDADMRERFSDTILAAESGRLTDWEATLQGRLALILVTDQFPRNVYRDTADAFRFDACARQQCKLLLAHRSDRYLRPIERTFCYMPLEHSENLHDQVRCVSLFRELRDGVGESLQEAFDMYLDFAIRHHAIIERFGRFPHRNAILGRDSTPEEVEFLRQPGSSF